MRISRGKQLLGTSVTALMLAAVPSVAGAAVGDVSLRSCVSETGTDGACADGRVLQGSFDVAISPDGKHAYSAAYISDALVIFDRAANGSLTQRAGQAGCLSLSGTGGECATTGQIDGPRSVLVSPDGLQVYVAAQNSNTIAAFDRDPATGNLTRKPGLDACIAENGGSTCRDGRSLFGPINIVFSTDAKQIYVSHSQGVTVLRRGANGVLTQPADPTGCISEDGKDSAGTVGACTDGRFLGQTYQIAPSPDGKHVYMTHDGFVGASSFGVLIFDRDPSSGALVQPSGVAGCIASDGHPSVPGDPSTNQCLANNAFDSNTWTASISPDGKFVYVLMTTGIVAFARNADTGALTQVQCLRRTTGSGCSEHTGFSQFFSGAVSPDLTDFVALDWHGSNGGLFFYTRDPSTGLLTRRSGTDGCITVFGSSGACRVAPMLGDSGFVRFSPDGSSFVATFRGGASVVTFNRDVAPVCQPVTAAIAHNTVTPVDLRCSDPNGDPVTLEIASGPSGGGLAAIDQDAKTVRYNPFAGFSGPDSFTYRGVALGVASQAATVTLNVAAAPSAGGGPPPEKLTNGVVHVWRAGAKSTVVRRLVVQQAPAGSAIEVRCKGKGCPFKTKRLVISRTADANLARFFNFKTKRKGSKRKVKVVSKLRPGATIEVRLTKPGATGKVVRFKVRKKKTPSATVLCLPAGASQPQAC